jgi:para-nitrobenzyl esterase
VKQLVIRTACILSAIATVAPSLAAAKDTLTVKTDAGKAHGKAINEGKVHAWLGLPYAAPPVHELRWKTPQPVAKWSGERNATRYGAHCAQNHVFEDMVFQDNGPSEDCLYLNVYAPATSDTNTKLPVMFWIHGGGFSGGGSNEPRHNGDFLPLKGVVLVTINYRLGVFGFLATEDLAKEAGGAAGNYGLADMIAALRWVKANIKEFGGDPGDVTIFGESAGSFAVSTLMASPIAQGLFQKAIGESGGAVAGSTLAYDTLATREPKDSKWVSTLNVKSLAELRTLPTQTILEAAKKPGIGFPPDIDGKVLTEPVGTTYAAGKQARIPLIAGWNRDEGSFIAARGMTADRWKELAQKNFKDRADEFLKLYPGDTDEQALRSAIDFGSDQFIAYGTWAWLEAHRKTGNAPVYRYFFELAATPSKYHPGTFAFHSDDIEYVFGTLDTRPGWAVRPEDRTLSDQIMTYFTNFAKTGDPNGSNLTQWPKYNEDGYPLIHLNTTVTAGPDTLRSRYEFLERGMPPVRF